MKNIEDYLFFYIGCPIMICEPGIEPVYHHELEGYDFSLKKAIAERTSYDPSWIKPILRKLDELTTDEKFNIQDICGWLDYNKFINQGISTPEVFRYLISKRFDIFGLIDSGLAIENKVPENFSDED